MLYFVESLNKAKSPQQAYFVVVCEYIRQEYARLFSLAEWEDLGDDIKC